MVWYGGQLGAAVDGRIDRLLVCSEDIAVLDGLNDAGCCSIVGGQAWALGVGIEVFEGVAVVELFVEALDFEFAVAVDVAAGVAVVLSSDAAVVELVEVADVVPYYVPVGVEVVSHVDEAAADVLVVALGGEVVDVGEFVVIVVAVNVAGGLVVVMVASS